jgi:hypothetical protein
VVDDGVDAEGLRNLNDACATVLVAETVRQDEDSGAPNTFEASEVS